MSKEPLIPDFHDDTAEKPVNQPPKAPSKLSTRMKIMSTLAIGAACTIPLAALTARAISEKWYNRYIAHIDQIILLDGPGSLDAVPIEKSLNLY